MRKIILKFLSLIPILVQNRLSFYFEKFSRSYFHFKAVSVIVDHLKKDKLCYLDVGARRGVDAKHWRYKRYLNFILFEPDPIECKFLQQFYPDIRNLAISDKEGELELNITEDPGGSYTSDNSLAQENYRNDLLRRAGVVGKKTGINRKFVCEKKRLDQCDIKGPIVILKIDVQGDELSVLKGLGNLRPGCLKVEISSGSNEQKPSQLEEILVWARKNNYLLVATDFSNKQIYPFKSAFETSFQGDYLFIDAGYKNCLETQSLVSIGLLLYDCANLAVAVLDDKLLASKVEKELRTSSNFSFNFALSKYNNAHDNRHMIL